MWTDERIDRLKALWGAGLSATQIAAQLGGVTRNAVLGKAFRLKLASHKVLKSFANVSRGQPSRAERRARLVQTAMKRKLWLNVRIAPLEPFTPVPEPVIPPHERKRILIEKDGALHANEALTPECCRWPCGDPGTPEFGFCGRTKFEGLSYCEDHARIAYQSPQSQAQERQRTAERKRHLKLVAA